MENDIGHIKDQVRSAAESAASGLSDGYERAMEGARENLGRAQTSAEAYIRDHPWLAVAAAVGVGFLLARLSDDD